jgi:hypothetical protein
MTAVPIPATANEILANLPNGIFRVIDRLQTGHERGRKGPPAVYNYAEVVRMFPNDPSRVSLTCQQLARPAFVLLDESASVQLDSSLLNAKDPDLFILAGRDE